MIGQTISHYKILKKLSEGSIGVVYKAQDLHLGRYVAIKFLSSQLISDETHGKRFIREAEAASALDHPNICTIYEIDKTTDGQMYIVMGYYEGETLQEKMERGPLEITEAINFVIQVAQGLASVHENGMIHRDIKPANIMLTEKNDIKILDFGLAKLDYKVGLTSPGTTLGTLVYMSPEQLKGATLDQRTDLWPLGVILYEMLTGELPFSGEYDQAMIYSIINDTPKDINLVKPEIPAKLNKIIQKILKKKPEDRYQQMEDLLKELTGVLSEVKQDQPSPEQLKREDQAALSARKVAEKDLTEIGSYKVIRRIGDGGMGTVYLAERADKQYRQHVVIKVLKRGMDSEDILRRFRSERQILASLDHPNIVKLHDGGLTEDDRPYFVMSYIEAGIPIDRYCDQKKLGIKERLNLFQSVCKAVHYAHQNLIVHRDLKPGNILVSQSGQVNLLDFGIAKILNPDLFSITLAVTRKEHHLMTPGYASPEQVRGEVISTASDVYSLGIILYELLTGHPPYQFKTLSPTEVERVVCEQEPLRPSTILKRIEKDQTGETDPLIPIKIAEARGTQEDKLRRQLAGDLDTIVLKALRKETSRRYTSADQLDEDIRRYLNGRPIRARTDTLNYRISKFIRRHRLGVSAVIIILVLLFAGLAGTVWQAQIARTERDRARLEATKSAEVTTFMKNLFKASDPREALGDSITARELLERGEARIEKLSEQPDVQAQMLDIMGTVYTSLGRYEKAEVLLEKASTLNRDLEEKGKVEALDVSNVINHLAWLMNEKGEYDKAEELYLESLDILKKDNKDKPEEITAVLNDLAVVRKNKGDYVGAEPLYRESLAIRKTVYGDRHLLTARSLNNLAVLLARMGDTEEAEPLFREAHEIKRIEYGENHPSIANSLTNLAILASRRNDYQAADSLFREALVIRKKVYGEVHPRIAMSLTNLATLLSEKGDFKEAEPIAREALKMRRELLGNDHPELAYTLLTMVGILENQNKFEEAESLCREAFEIRRKKLGFEHWQTAQAQSWLGACLTNLGRYQEAEKILIEGYKNMKLIRGEDDQYTVRAINRLITLYNSWGKPEKEVFYQSLLSDSTDT